jgi:predicted PurR-regulated permease PerM
MRAWVSDILPLSPARRESFMAEIGQAVEAVFYGIIVIAVVQGVLAGVLWWIGGLPNPLLWGTITFVFSMVPALGPTAVLYPGAIYAFVVGNYVGAAVLAIGGGASILVIDVYLRPWLIGNRGSLDPTLILVAIAGGVTVLGPFGLVAGPLALAVFLKISAFVIETHDVPPPGRSPAANGPSSRDHETDASSSGRARGEGGPVTPT